VIAVRRDPETRRVERVEVLLDKRFMLAFRRHPARPRMLVKSMAADLGADRMMEPIRIPDGLWKQALRRAYAIFFPPRE
jgi:hypothetical protein